MSFLAPLYALAAMSVALPILFHLIQRRPRGRFDFSSLMFLSPSPPRLTRRSRLTNWLLLLLRATALILLAAAFARPFLRSFTNITSDIPARRQLILLDTSASMRRDGLTQALMSEVAKIADDLQPTDQIALMTFDRVPRMLMNWDQLASLPGAQRAEALRSAAATATPTWHATDLGTALVAAADSLRDVQRPDDAPNIAQHVIVVSDLQEGSQLDAVSKFTWPSHVQIDLRRLTPAKPSNASAQVLPRSAQEIAERAPVRVRVANAADSQKHVFRVAWAKSDGSMVGDHDFPADIPAGSTQVITVEAPIANATELRLLGDDHPFDNSVFVASMVRQERKILYLGLPADTNQSNLAFFLQSAVLENDRYRFVVEQHAPDATLSMPTPRDTPLVVVNALLAQDTIATLKTYLERGGHLLVVITSDLAMASEISRTNAMLRAWSANEELTLSEGAVTDYAMLTNIDFHHPLFRPFSDPRFSDFTKIRVWKRRVLTPPESPHWRILARFDDNRSPAWIEETVGEGLLSLLPFGWHPAESQLALSTKFIPLMMGAVTARSSDEAVSVVPALGRTVPFLNRDADTYAILPDGTRKTPTDTDSDLSINEPGIYRWVDRGEEVTFAVNLASAESNTAPLDATSLESRGLVLRRALTSAEIAEQQRQMRDIEIEGQQQIWRWLLVALLTVLAAETWLAHRTFQAPRSEQAIALT